MAHIVNRGRYARETYPEARAGAEGPTGPTGPAGGEGEAPLGGMVALLDDVGGGFYTVTDGNYKALGGSTNYGFQGSGFTLNTTGCILTYTGSEPKTFLVVGIASNSTPFAAALGSWGIAHNGDLIGQAILGGQTGPTGCCLQNFPDTNEQFMTSTQRRVTLAPGDTIQPVGGTAGGTVNMDMTTFTISVQECA